MACGFYQPVMIIIMMMFAVGNPNRDIRPVPGPGYPVIMIKSSAGFGFVNFGSAGSGSPQLCGYRRLHVCRSNSY
eukprot:538215-Rhodomonas_salina.1